MIWGLISHNCTPSGGVYGEPKRQRKCKFVQELGRLIPLLMDRGWPLETLILCLIHWKKVEGHEILLFKLDSLLNEKKKTS